MCCPYCTGLVPLSPNWRLAPDGTGVPLLPQLADGPGSANRVCAFEIANSAQAQSAGTIARGDGTCPYPDCGRVIDGDEIKRQAQVGGMGEQIYAVVFKRRVEYLTKAGKRRWKWERGYRAPRPEDDNADETAQCLAEKLPEWEAFDYVPSERFPEVCNDDRPIQYGMPLWRDLFSPRQLLCHGTGVEVFREMLAEDQQAGRLTDLRKATYGYLALTLDKLLNYNARMTRWHANRGVLAGTFDRHDFAFKWSYAEMAPLVTGVGYDWAVEQTAKCIKELVELVRPADAGDDGQLFETAPPPPVTVTCKPGDRLDHVGSASVDVVVMDPPYYDNVMYAELSDFFYVWLKRTAGHVFPELFRRALTDKENEAVANPARHRGEKGAAALAARDYRERMAAIFAEGRRVLSDDETTDHVQDAEEVSDLERRALAAEERGRIASLLATVEKLPPDSKLTRLVATLERLRSDGFAQAMVFTQYTDTMDFLRGQLVARDGWRLMCYSGRGGEVPGQEGAWHTVTRDEAKSRFRSGKADVLLCTDAAAEGLNFQFCGALVNYDMPWNPMRVEQRIGRIDRLGQRHARIRVVNLHYEDTVETDVYRALRIRIGLFESVVGPLQPILARLPGEIGSAVLQGSRRDVGEVVAARIDEAAEGFDIDDVLDKDIRMPERPPSALDMTYLARLLSTPELMPPASKFGPWAKRSSRCGHGGWPRRFA